MFGTIKESYKPIPNKKLSVFKMSTTVEDVVSAIHSIGESYTYNDYVCIMLWIKELGPGGYDKVVYALEDV